MKFLKYIAVAALSACLAACSSDEEYVKGTAEGMQVYVPADVPSQINLELGQTSFSIPVERVDASQAATVAVKVTTEEESIYTFPSSVSFAAGEKTAQLTATVDVTKQVYGMYEDVVVELIEGTTPYAPNKTTIKVGVPEPWTPWINGKSQWVKAGFDEESWPFGDKEPSTATYTYTQIFGGDDPDLPLYYRQNKVDPTKAEIRIDNWGYGVSLTLEYNPQTHNIQIPKQTTAYVDKNVGEFFITDVSHWQGKDYYAAFPCTYNPETGFGLLNTAWMAGEDGASCYGYGEEYFQVGGFYVPDYSVSAVFQGILTQDKLPYAQVMVTLGTDAQTVKGIIVPKGSDAGAVADALLAGDVEGTDIVEGINNIPLEDATGDLVLIIASIADEEVKDLTATNFEYYGGASADPWKELGIGLWTDCIVPSVFNLPQVQVPCLIKENTETPGLYRIMDPYGEEWAHAKYNSTTPVDYIEINACDPDGVYVAPQMVGVNIQGNGDMGYMSAAAYDLVYEEADFETLKQEGALGTVKEGIITLPVASETKQDGSTVEYYGFVIVDDGLYYGRVPFLVVLPSAMTEEVAQAKKMAPAMTSALRMNGIAFNMKAHRSAKRLNMSFVKNPTVKVLK